MSQESWAICRSVYSSNSAMKMFCFCYRYPLIVVILTCHWWAHFVQSLGGLGCFPNQSLMTSLSTQIVIDDDLMEYELNPKMLTSLEPRAHQAKRPHFMIHDLPVQHHQRLWLALSDQQRSLLLKRIPSELPSRDLDLAGWKWLAARFVLLVWNA